MDRNDIFKERFEEIRRHRNVTQKEIADAIGLTSQAISSYLSGRTKPSLDIAAKIAEFFGVSLDWLCGLSSELTVQGSIPKTYGELIMNIDKLLKMDMFITMDYMGGDPAYPDGNFAEIHFHDYYLADFFKEWMRVKELRDNKTIDKELYELWIEKQLGKLWVNQKFLNQEDQIEYYTLNHDDDPF